MQSLHEFQHSHHIFPKGLKVLFISRLLRAIGLQFDSFFMPLFLYQLGAKFQPFPITAFQNGMILLGMYFIFERVSVLFLSLPVSRIINKIGIRNSMILSQFLYVFVLVLYIYAQQHIGLFILILILEGIRLPLYWTSYYTLFSANAIYSKMGQSVGTSLFFIKLLQAAIPALSGLIIVQFGFSYIFFISIFFQGLSILTMLFLHEKERVAQPSILGLKTWLKDRQFRLLSLSFSGKYIADSLQSLWPLFVLLLIGSADKVGYLYFVVFFVSLLLTYFSGWYVDHSKSRRPFSVSGVIIGSVWLIRSAVVGSWSIMAVDIFHQLAESVFTPFYDSLLMRRGKSGETLSYFIYREMVLSFSGVIFWGIFIIYFVFSSSWRSFILFGFIAVLMSMQLHDKVKSIEVGET